MVGTEERFSNVLRVISLVVFGGYLLGLVFPSSFWGMHHLAFLPGIVQAIVVIVGVYFLFVYPKSKEKPLSETLLKPLAMLDGIRGRLIFAGILGVCFYALPIHTDTYGDALFVFGPEKETPIELTGNEVGDILSLDFSNPKIGTDTTFALVSWLSAKLQIGGVQTFRLWDAVWGALFVLVWLTAVGKWIKSQGWRSILILTGVTAPILQMFFGHFEIYAPIYVGVSVLFFLLFNYLELRTGKQLLWLVLAQLFCMKFHVTSFVFLPVILLVCLYHFKPNLGLLQKIESPKGFLSYILLPLIGLGVALYIYLGGFEGVRQFDKDSWDKVVFLPISSIDEAPLDRYNLFSPAHFFDYFNMWYLWSVSAIMLIVGLLITYFRNIDFSDKGLRFAGLVFVLQFGFFFLFNPLLAMPNDWDLYGVCAITLLYGLLWLCRKIELPEVPKIVYGSVLTFALFSVSVFVMNSNGKALSEKLVAQGIWEYKTYWRGASSSIVEGLWIEEDVDVRQGRLENVISELEPWAVKGNDIEFAELLHQAGMYYFQIKNNYLAASEYFSKANSYSVGLCKNHYNLMTSYFMIGELDKAVEHADETVACQYPDQRKALLGAIHVCLEANQDEMAHDYCRQFLEVWPDDGLVRSVNEALKRGVDATVFFASPGDGNARKQVKKPDLAFLELQNVHNVTPVINDSLLQIYKKLDPEIKSDYAELLAIKIGLFHQNYLKQQDSAIYYFEQGFQKAATPCASNFYLLAGRFLNQDMLGAMELCQGVLECEYPNPKKAHRVVLHTCVAAGEMEDAEGVCRAYLERWPNDDFVKRIHQKIGAGVGAEEVLKMFQNSAN